jgi:hypothetical protein
MNDRPDAKYAASLEAVTMTLKTPKAERSR